MRRLAASVAAAWVAAALAGCVVAGAPALAASHGGRPAAKACSRSQVAATLDLADTASGSTSPAGAVIFHDKAKGACTLVGVPTVTASSTGGGAIRLYEYRSIPHHAVPVVLTPGSSGKGAASSITWSAWTCAPSSYSVAVRFSGWSSAIKLSSGKSPTKLTCTQPGQTVYVGAVGPLKG